MSDTLITENDNVLIMETVSGIPGSSSLNDINVVSIFSETFDTNPVSRGWQVGTSWTWDAVNLRMKIA